MTYYFKIADIGIRIDSEFEILWNSYAEVFLVEEPVPYQEHYICCIKDAFTVQGSLIYEDAFQKIFTNGTYEERLHYFYGYEEPCMHYIETSDNKRIEVSRRYLEVFEAEDNHTIFNALAFEKVLMKHQAVVLHCSYIIWKDQAILFTAPSGTGKSTQAALWEKERDARIVNGDRAILTVSGNQVYAHGMPICGSSDICRNQSAPVRAIIYLEQSPVDTIDVVPYTKQVKRMLSETTINFFNNEYVEQALSVLMDVSARVPMYHLACTKNASAVEILERILVN